MLTKFATVTRGWDGSDVIVGEPGRLGHPSTTSSLTLNSVVCETTTPPMYLGPRSMAPRRVHILIAAWALYTFLSIASLGSLDLSTSSLVSAALFVATNKRTFQITLYFCTPVSPSRKTADISPPPLTEITRRSPRVRLP